ncbi:tryptophan RNA-binding attenuation protein [Bacillus nakamurai]|uniref:tryptophan RNA-binding attenuation protein n=1 Tax=Bacillus nakamurai TaxID=1793963 RepID=UPI000AE5B17F
MVIAADDLEVTCPHSEGTGAGGRDTLPEMRRKGVIWTAQEFYQKAFELKNI